MLRKHGFVFLWTIALLMAIKLAWYNQLLLDPARVFPGWSLLLSNVALKWGLQALLLALFLYMPFFVGLGLWLVLQDVFLFGTGLYYAYFDYYPDYLEALRSPLESLSAAGLPPLDMASTLLIWPLLLDVVIVALWAKGLRAMRRLRKVPYFFLKVVALGLVPFLAVEGFYASQGSAWWQIMRKPFAHSATHSTQHTLVKQYGVIVGSLANSSLDLEFRGDYGTWHESPGQANHYNVVMIQLETGDAFLPHILWEGKPVSPFLRSLTTNSLYFPYLLSYHYRTTASAEFSVLNLVEPPLEWSSFLASNASYPNSLVHAFRKAGYTTLGFHNGIGKFFRRKTQWPLFGFDEVYFAEQLFPKDQLAFRNSLHNPNTVDHLASARVLKRLSRVQEPFFAFWVTLSGHFDFSASEPYWDTGFHVASSDLLSRYLNTAYYVDQTIQHFVEGVRAVHPNTVFIIYGDHSAPVSLSGILHTAHSKLPPQARDFPENLPLEFTGTWLLLPKTHWAKTHWAKTQLHEPRLNESRPNESRPNESRPSFTSSGLVLIPQDIGLAALESAGIPYRIRSQGQNPLQPLSNSAVPYRGQRFLRSQLWEWGQAMRHFEAFHPLVSAAQANPSPTK